MRKLKYTKQAWKTDKKRRGKYLKHKILIIDDLDHYFNLLTNNEKDIR